jgi:hypothetical protein
VTKPLVVADGGAWHEDARATGQVADSVADVTLVKAALESLDRLGDLAGHPLARLPYLAGDGRDRGSQLRELLIDVVQETALSKQPRDAEAGNVLLLYYVKRAGTLEAIGERLYLTRPTLFRRLNRGLALVSERLNDLEEDGGADGKHAAMS